MLSVGADRQVTRRPPSNVVLDLLEEHVQGLRLGPFEYGIAHRRGERHLLMRSAELDSPESLYSELDVPSPPWLEPTTRSWVPWMCIGRCPHVPTSALRSVLLMGTIKPRREPPRVLLEEVLAGRPGLP
jgi:hypothetical protein